jgi:hypothetical protein
MGYFAIVLTLAVALVGIRGRTWDDTPGRGRWWRRITLTGWAAVGLAVCSGALSLFEARRAAEKQARIERIAYGQVREALNVMLQPYLFLATGDCRTDSATKLADCALDTSFREHLWTMKILDRPNPEFLPFTPSWASLSAKSAAQASESLEDVEVQFRSDLSPDVLSMIDALRNSGQLIAAMSFLHLVQLNRDQGKDVDQITIGLAMSGFANDYVPFFKLTKRLAGKVGDVFTK